MSITSLTAPQRRVVGVLIEKSLTTPSNYPLSLNAVTTGCNQKSNRDPVVEYVEEETDRILEELKGLGLMTVVYPASGRVEKYRQELSSLLDLDGQEMAVLAELLLRGAQSVGELRTRASRMKGIADLNELDRVLGQLAGRDHPLVVRLTPEGVKRGVRYTHNLYEAGELERVRQGEPAPAAEAAPAAPVSSGAGLAADGAPAAPAPASRGVSGGGGAKVDALERQIKELTERLEIVEGRLGIDVD
ncbi:MAG: DUF480 domain-containing protein [Planctomycetota bacterium]